MRFRIRRKWMMSGLMITLSFLFLLFLFPAAAQETADQNVLKEQPAAGEAQSLIQPYLQLRTIQKVKTERAGMRQVSFG